MLQELLAVAICASQALSQNGFEFPGFAGAADISLVKDARRQGNALRVAPARRNASGAVWINSRQVLGFGFETTFRFQLTQQDGDVYAGADGLAFVIQNAGPKVVAGRGAAGGFAIGRGDANPKTKGIPRSLAIFFDTYQNQEEDDPSGNYAALYTNGDGHFLPRQLARSERLAVNLKDGRPHTVKVVYQPPQLQVFLDSAGEAIFTSEVELSSIIGSEGLGYLGFTAATGDGFQNHDVLDWSFTPKQTAISSSIQFHDACLPNRTLCTPEAAKVEAISPTRYRILLPANLEWGASIPNAAGKPVSINGTKGTVCWNPLLQNAHACNGPGGEAGKGDLIQQTRNGRTYFSINAPKGTFDKNEGYFDFEAEVR